MKTILILISVYFWGVCQAGHLPNTIGPDIESRRALNLYIDCEFCDLDYFRSRFELVNYVTDPAAADVHIVISSVTTGSGGQSYTLLFKGRQRFDGLSYSIYFSTGREDTDEVIRSTILDRIKTGLAPFILQTDQADKISLTIDEVSSVLEGGQNDDRWNSWAFQVGADGAFASDKTMEDLSFSGHFNISRVTEKFKVQSGNGIGWSKTRLSLYDGDSLILEMKSGNTNLYNRNLVVWSLGKHAGLGATGTLSKSDYSNLDYRISIGPAIEFNLFEYAESSMKQCRLIYSATFEHSDYKSLTVNDRMTDDLFQHELEFIFSYLDSWGTVSASAFANHYLNDLSHYSLGSSLMAAVSLSQVRPLEGMSVVFTGNCSYFRNQVSLRKEMEDLGSVISGQTEMEKGLSYYVTVGLAYNFGSRNNNVINPRLER